MDFGNASLIEIIFTVGALVGLGANGAAAWLNGRDWWLTRRDPQADAAQRRWAVWLFSIQVGLEVVNVVNLLFGGLALIAPPGRNTTLSLVLGLTFLTSDLITAGIGVSWLIVRAWLLRDLTYVPPAIPEPDPAALIR